MVSPAWTMRSARRVSAIIRIMRCPVDLPAYLIRDAELYAPGRKGSEAVEWILADYPRLVGEIRNLRKSADSFAQESAELDQLVDQLKAICLRILDL
ncbi:MULTISPECIES: DASH complex subunit Dad3 [unclassified Pseudomonas]|uniref:DASH complex subunit Dad3 n=1 Tax=unclassified Pseudomonas TaxID=196821 RepID=UPI00244C07E4|nr:MULTISPECIES: DASH complex subunit Dad3 [unclassified Pseudomonas]MDG9922892.1 DASH complex subunit Dad3 [Pseudomonas sp. GD04045]MDH0035744.1 DASH complex subunit Dad3 [Pseudomonas sp. GD04019]